jgi:hypothetical protein
VAADETAKLLTEYQRVGHALIELRIQRGTAATSELWDDLHALDIQHATATASSRESAKAALEDLQTRIERSRGIEVSDACKNNPLASGCE